MWIPLQHLSSSPLPTVVNVKIEIIAVSFLPYPTCGSLIASSLQYRCNDEDFHSYLLSNTDPNHKKSSTFYIVK